MEKTVSISRNEACWRNVIGDKFIATRNMESLAILSS